MPKFESIPHGSEAVVVRTQLPSTSRRAEAGEPCHTYHLLRSRLLPQRPTPGAPVQPSDVVQQSAQDADASIGCGTKPIATSIEVRDRSELGGVPTPDKCSGQVRTEPSSFQLWPDRQLVSLREGGPREQPKTPRFGLGALRS